MISRQHFAKLLKNSTKDWKNPLYCRNYQALFFTVIQAILYYTQYPLFTPYFPRLSFTSVLP